MIPAKLLQQYNARSVRTRKDQVLFEEGETAHEFFQVDEGQVRMYILNHEGQEFTQGIFNAGESFGEPPLFGDFPYPSTAIALTSGKVWRLPKKDFLNLLKDNFELHLKLDHVLCNRLQYKSMILTEISSHDPEHRILTILKYLKSKMNVEQPGKIVMPYTRQQLADMTSLRVETVIRTIKRMEKEAKLELQGHKILF
ncbi:MAG: Crp/Fnr family transcriptional regulator [Cyclobacteriaceae bacterium]|nr:Crp/Fnr family transcriptional regulator [Cyclobacteriaceae bacterium]MBX2955018.1 Crp/Fnr family transcriptional regulator [Cyclobacteriaceae bacterium]